MRITSGILRGRQVKVPKVGVRPTTERTREAIFSALAARVGDARVLDLFAGAGGLGLEAWSRGAASVTAVEKNPKNCGIIRKNFESMVNDDLGSHEVVRADAYAYCARVWDPYTLVFADPPYDEVDLHKLLDVIGKALAPDGLLVFEMRGRDPYTIPEGWTAIRDKKYGSTRILFLERTV